MMMPYHDLLAPEQITAASIDTPLGEIVLVEDIPSVCGLTCKGVE